MEVVIFLSFLTMAYLLIKVNSQAEEIYYLRFEDLSPEPTDWLLSEWDGNWGDYFKSV